MTQIAPMILKKSATISAICGKRSWRPWCYQDNWLCFRLIGKKEARFMALQAFFKPKNWV